MTEAYEFTLLEEQAKTLIIRHKDLIVRKFKFIPSGVKIIMFSDKNSPSGGTAFYSSRYIKRFKFTKLFEKCETNVMHIEINLFHCSIGNRIIKSEFLDVLVHELTHVNQVLSKKMTFYRNGRRFDGKKYKNSNIFESHEDHNAYLNLPWEVEARKMAKKYVQECI